MAAPASWTSLVLLKSPWEMTGAPNRTKQPIVTRRASRSASLPPIMSRPKKPIARTHNATLRLPVSKRSSQLPVFEMTEAVGGANSEAEIGVNAMLLSPETSPPAASAT